ncbi:hypothetical protein AAHC03_016481 [Spirometra sp. Aus1]
MRSSACFKVHRLLLPLLLFTLLLLSTSNSQNSANNVITVILSAQTQPSAGTGAGTGGRGGARAKKKVVDVLRKIAQSKDTPKLAIHVIQENKATTVMAALCHALAAERATAVGSLPPTVAHLVSSLANTFALPYITWDGDLNRGKWASSYLPHDASPHPTASPFNPGCHIFSVRPGVTQPLLDFLASWKWKQFAYLYGSEEAFNRLKIVLRKAQAYEGETAHQQVRPRVAKEANSKRPPSPPIIHGFVDADDPEQMRMALKSVDLHLSTQTERNVIIDLGGPPVDATKSGRERLATVFTWLTRMGMMRTEYNYLLVDFDLFELSFDVYQRSGVNITGFHVLEYQDPLVAKFAADWHDSGMSLHDIAFMIDAMELARQTKRMTNSIVETLPPRNSSNDRPKCYTQRGTLVSKELVQRWKPGDEVSKWLLHQEISGQSGILRFDPLTCSRTGYSLVLSSAFGSLETRTIAKWSFHSGWVLPSDASRPSFFNRKHTHGAKEKTHESLNYNNILEVFRAQNKTLRVVSVLSKPFMMHGNNVPETVTSGRHNFAGYCKELADRIFDHLNLNYEIHLVKDGLFGAIDPTTNSWNGMVGEVLRGEADIIIAPLTMSTARAKYIDFTEPFMNFGLSLMLRKPGKTKPGMFSFLSPLTNSVWLCTAAATVVVALALTLIASISPKERMRPDAHLGLSLGNSLWFSFASFVHEGIDIFPISASTRVFTSIWRYFCLVIMAYYTANLAAALSVERLISPINSIKDFAEYKDLPIKVGTLDSGSTKDFFATSTDHIYKTIYQGMLKDPSVFVPTMQAGFDRVRNSPYAFVVESKMNEFVNHRRPCNTMMVGSTFGSKAYAIGVSSNRPDMRIFKEHITDAILRLREEQILAKMYKEWWIEKGECFDGKGGPTSEPLALVNLSGVFYILIAGLVLAILIGASLFMCRLKRYERLHRSYQRLAVGNPLTRQSERN